MNKIVKWLWNCSPAGKREQEDRQKNLKRWKKNRQINLNLLESIVENAPEGAIIVIQQDGEALDRMIRPAVHAEQCKETLKASNKELGILKAQSFNRDFMAFFAGKVTPKEIEEDLVWTDVIERFWIFEQ